MTFIVTTPPEAARDDVAESIAASRTTGVTCPTTPAYSVTDPK